MLLASNSSHTYTTQTFCKIIFHKARKGWSELQGHPWASLHRIEFFVWCYTWSVRARSSVFPYKCSTNSSFMWFGMQWTYIFQIWTSLTEGCFRFQMLTRFVCVDCSRMRLCTTPCKWFNALASQNGFMTQNECKHSQLYLKGLNRQYKTHYFLYFKRDLCMNAA